MHHVFRVDNPVWKFIGRLADYFFLSLLWALCSVLVVTIGASTTALYDVVMHMAEDTEGRIYRQFLESLRRNGRQATVIWLGFLAVGAVLCIDILYALQGSDVLAMTILVVSSVLIFLWAGMVSFVFPLLAWVDNAAWPLVKMAGAMVSQNILPVLTGLILYAAFLSVGLFVFWPVLLITPALPAYLCGKLYLRILQRYGLRGEDGGKGDV